MFRIRWNLAWKVLLVCIRPWLWRIHILSKSDLNPDPVTQFDIWFKRAKRSIWFEFPNAMTLATYGVNGYPASRVVLLKDFDSEGFVFYTNTLSAKGHEIADNPRVSLSFYWEALQRQVRIQGDVVSVTKEEADEYFKTRMRGSQIGAWASTQSEVLENRKTLKERVNHFKQKFKGQPVPRPEHWSGYRVKPVKFEFWQLRKSRLHDRFVYNLKEDQSWDIQRLYP